MRYQANSLADIAAHFNGLAKKAREFGATGNRAAYKVRVAAIEANGQFGVGA